MSLVIVGSVALDSVETPFGKVEKALGGSAIYASMSAKHFCKPQIVGVIGRDFPNEHIVMLKNNNICTKGLQITEGKTFHWKGVYNDLNTAETLDTQLNVFADFNPQLPEDYRNTNFVLLGNIDPTLQLNVLAQMDNPLITACDTMNFWINGKNTELMSVIKKIHILFINNDEIKMLTGEYNVFAAAKSCLQMGPKYIIIKQGEFGSIAIGKDFMFSAPVFPVEEVVDPTGAGDSFAGGFMGYLSQFSIIEEEHIKMALLYGTVLASFDVQNFSLDNLKNIDQFSIKKRFEFVKNSISL